MFTLRKSALKSSGIAVDDECSLKFEELKMKKIYSYVIYKITDSNTKIKVDCVGELGETFDQFKERLRNLAEDAKEGRYAVIDVPSGSKETKQDSNSIVLITWVSDEYTPKQKMLYASSKDALVKKLTGVKKYLQINDWSEFTLEEIQTKLKNI